MVAVERNDQLDAHIFATGMHMLARYGSTVNEIKKVGFANIHTFVNQDASVNSHMDLTLALTVQGLGHYIRELKPHLIVVHGDRIEALAGAIVGALNNILVAHVEGGEVSGTVDELIRHSVTKLSHIHFVANDQAKLRLIQMGETPDSVFVIGSPEIDVMLSSELPTLKDVFDRYDVSFTGEYGICMFHPVTTEVSEIGTQALTLVQALQAVELPFVVIYPNNDSGSHLILSAYDSVDGDPRFRLIPSMRFEYFLTLLKNASVIVGNSSAGVREAPVYGVPSVNIGTRQTNRFKYPSILDVPADEERIVNALRSLPKTVTPTLHFGTGQSARLFMEVLYSDQFWNASRQKLFQDLQTVLPSKH